MKIKTSFFIAASVVIAVIVGINQFLNVQIGILKILRTFRHLENSMGTILRTAV